MPLLFLIFMLGIICGAFSLMLWDDSRKLGIGFLIIGVLMVSTALTYTLSRTPFNDSQQTVNVKRGDTLYVVPKGSINGLAITVGRDSTGLVLVVKNFTAQHTVKPRVEQ
ncbi:MAG: hypothetical protein AAB402_00015 [Patescibacteria group bacterium]